MRRRLLICLRRSLLILALLLEGALAHGQASAPTSFPPLWASECITCDQTSIIGGYVALALDHQDYIHVAYDGAGGTNLLSAYQDAEGWHFAVVNDYCWQISDIFLQVDAQGYEHVIYDCEYHDTIRYAYRNADGWHDQEIFTKYDFVDGVIPAQSVTAVEVTAQSVTTESLALDSAGRPHGTVRGEMNKGLIDIFYIHMDESEWQVELLAHAAAYGVIALDAQDTVHAAYMNLDWLIFHATRGEQGWQPEFVADSAGQPHIVNSGYGPPMYYKRKTDGAWQPNPITTGGVFVEPRMRLDAQDAPLICSQGNGILLFTLLEGDTWRTRILAGTPGPPDMALDSRGGVHFAHRGFDGNVIHLYPYPGPWFTSHLPAVFK